MSSLASTTGEIDFVYDGQTLKTWYKVFGDLSSGATPLVVLHGGPGLSHNYLLPLAVLASRGIPVIFYDQIGGGQSTHLPDKPAEFWAFPLFIAELENVLAHFRITARFDLVGHSWGGMLAQEYAAQRQPTGLRRLVLTDSLPALPLWVVSVNKLLKRLPQNIQDTIKKHEADGTLEDEEFKEAKNVFYAHFVCKVNPFPQELLDTFELLEKDPTVNMTMQGPTEFTITGTLKTWDMIDRLHLISAPTLVINGADDEASDEVVGPLFQKIPRSKWVQFAKSSHTPFYEEKERFMQIVGDYLCEE
ncbi:proline-specific peptidase [Phanerochaete sordida]|uniref:Proline-specific peptidase n=1 Tax=Phanerochaete sordida TaxID=48140 RepID=A0A9P3LAT4_9APHY|nr:proline-specific peptidase [Phanerochaete sordida]